MTGHQGDFSSTIGKGEEPILTMNFKNNSASEMLET